MSGVAVIALIDVLCGAAIVGTISYVEAVRASGRISKRILGDCRGAEGCRGEAEVRVNVGLGCDVGPAPLAWLRVGVFSELVFVL